MADIQLKINFEFPDENTDPTSPVIKNSSQEESGVIISLMSYRQQKQQEDQIIEKTIIYNSILGLAKFFPKNIRK